MALDMPDKDNENMPQKPVMTLQDLISCREAIRTPGGERHGFKTTSNM